MKNTTYANLLTEEQKAAFRKGDAYYVSPFKNINIRKNLEMCNRSNPTGSIYNTTSFARVYEAKQDRIVSQQWN